MKKSVQLFEEHIEASIESKKPLIIHSRSAENKTYEILKAILKIMIKNPNALFYRIKNL